MIEQSKNIKYIMSEYYNLFKYFSTCTTYKILPNSILYMKFNNE